MEGVVEDLPDISSLHIYNTHSTIQEDSGDIHIPDAPKTPQVQTDVILRPMTTRARAAVQPSRLLISAGRDCPILRLKYTPCPNHCTRDVGAALFHNSPPTFGNVAFNNGVFARLDRLVELGQKEVHRLQKRSLVQLTEEMAITMEDTMKLLVRSTGEDEGLVKSRIAWAKWAVEAAKAGLFHEKTLKCGSIANQVQVRTIWRLELHGGGA